MVCHHRVYSPSECRRMMRPKLLDVTKTSLTTCYTSLCYSCRRNTYSLNKGLLIKYWWCLTSTMWTPSTSSSSTSHLHNLNDKFNLNAVSLRLKHSPEILFIHINQCIQIVLAFTSNARQLIIHLKHFFFTCYWKNTQKHKYTHFFFHFFQLLEE